MQNFNKAAIFQDGRPGLSWNTIVCFKNDHSWSEKNILIAKVICFLASGMFD